MNVHTSTHEGAADTAARIAEEFSNDPRVQLRCFENSTESGLWLGGFELTAKSTGHGATSTKRVRVLSPVPPPRVSQGQLTSLTRSAASLYARYPQFAGGEALSGLFTTAGMRARGPPD
jgi:hypothetical protein